MTIRRVVRDNRVDVIVEHHGVTLKDYTYAKESASDVERRLCSLAERLTVKKELIE